MAKKISNKINSQFMPTYIDGVPIFMCGGKMKYNLGGMINGVKDFAKNNWSAALGPAIGLGALLSGKKANEFAQENAGTLGTVAGGALGLAVGNPMLGSQIGGQIGSQIQGNNTQHSQLQQPQQDMLKQQLISNLPGQSSYIPTFENGGEITDRVASFDTGGLHSENGGVPIGQNAMVERDEFMFTNKQGKKYIFTNKF